MKSYTEGSALYGSLTKNTSTANLALGVQLANDDYEAVMAEKDWPFLEAVRPITTVANQMAYNLPYDCEIPREVAVIVSSKRYVPRGCPNRAFFDQLNFTAYTSDIPQWWYVFNGQVNIWPTPASAGNTINITQKCRVIPLASDDYSTGNVTAVTNGANTVTGSGTTWTAEMVGRYIVIGYPGDKLPYRISAVASATSLTIERAYGGTTVAGSSSYKIAQYPLLPSAFHQMPWLQAAAIYWNKEDDDRGDRYQTQHDNLLKTLIKTYSSPTGDMVLDDGGPTEILNPNLTVMVP